MMSAFNSMPALTSGGHSGPDALGLSHNGQALHMDFDQELAFDEALLDSVNHNLPPLPFTPSYDFETFSTTFEDPFSSYPTTARHYDAVVPNPEAYNGEESSPQELDNKLLGFSAPIIKAPIVPDESPAGGSAAGGGDYIEAGGVGMSAELYGMFFVAEDVFGGDNNPARPLELTCYRRNLWQCSGQITLPKYGVSAVITEQGRRTPVFDLAASITAIESIEGKPTEIISIPWKSSTANNPGAGAPEDTKVASAPPRVPLDLGSGQELDGNLVSVPVSWKRLQFKHATANNGRRKGLQQHYVVQINLLGKTKSGDFVKIAEIQSGPVIVRGRSPRNFDSRKDVPLTGDKKLERRSTDGSVGATPAPMANNGKPERGDLALNMQRYHSLGNIQSTDWMSSQVPFAQPQPPTPSQQQQHPSKKPALSPSLTRPPVPSWSSDPSITSLSQQQQNRNQQQQQQQPHPATPSMVGGAGGGSNGNNAMQTLPINLSLSEDERSPNNRSAGGSDPLSSPQFNKTLALSSSLSAAGGGGVFGAPMNAGTGGGAHPDQSPLETADMLYEYFPLSLDDWMPPVDAIYRPHVVHHTVVPPEVKAQQTRTKTKRYFTD